MSASLVGSEMCIRDRPRSAAARDAPAQWRSDATCVQDQTSISFWGWILPCLLYTSDAADDM
eukprot:13482624-Alexandrium_andersonii.AAC.1